MSTVLIVDDHTLIRQGVRSLLNRHSTVDVCGEASDGEEAVQKVGDLHPDIVLLDIEMPRMNGIQAAQQIHQLQPSTKIVFFTAHPQSLFDESTMWSNGFVSKLSAETQLIPTLNHLLQTNPEGFNGPLRYQWQHPVADALVSGRDSSPSKIAVAQQAIAARFADLKPLDRYEKMAMTTALEALQQLIQGSQDHQP